MLIQQMVQSQVLDQLKGMRLTLCSACMSQVRMSLTSRPLEGDLIEIGMECPFCHHWFHSYFLNPDLRDNRPKGTDSRKARREYQLRFQRFQKVTRKRLGMRKVNGKYAARQS